MFDRKAYMKIYHKRWYRKHKDSIAAKQVLYHKRHRQELLKYKKGWYKANSLRLSIIAKKRYARLSAEMKKARAIKTNYGMTIEDYKALALKQKYKCPICLDIPKYKLYVDHCHKTGLIRGLLCRKCNFALGLLNDNPRAILRAANYLREQL